MTILGFSKQRVMSYAIYVLILIIAFALLLQKMLTYNQFYICFFGDMGFYIVVDGMSKIVDSKLKSHKVFFTSILVSTIAAITFSLLILPIDSSMAVITMAIIDVLVLLSINALNWTAKRRLAKLTNNSQKII
jgi:hypothetical protein